MAATSVSLITNVLTDVFGNELTSQVLRDVKTLPLISVKTVRGAQSAFWSAHLSGSTAGTYSEGAAVSTYSQDARLPASLTWGLYHNPFSITSKAMAAAANPLNPSGVRDLIADEAMNAMQALVKHINGALYTGVGNGAINSFLSGSTGGAPLLPSGSYAGIGGLLTNAEWQPVVNQNAGVDHALSEALMTTQMFDMLAISGMRPKSIVMHPSVGAKYAALLSSFQQIIQPGSLGNIGFSGYSFQGIPIYFDEQATNKCVFFLNTDPRFMEIQVLDPGPATPSMGVVPIMIGGQVVPIQLHLLGKVGYSYDFSVTCDLQLCVKRRNVQGVIRDIAI